MVTISNADADRSQIGRIEPLPECGWGNGIEIANWRAKTVVVQMHQHRADKSGPRHHDGVVSG